MMAPCYAQKVWFQTGVLILACIPFVLAVAQFDMRTLNGIPVWVKPLKFHVSVAVHMFTFALLTRFLPTTTRNSSWLSVVAFISVAATLIEMLLIDYQAARGVHSHFNSSTAFDGIVYGVMGVCALLLSAPALIMGIRFLFLPQSAQRQTGIKWGAALGLLTGFVLTLGIAGYMSSQASGHWVGAPATDLDGMPVFGWSRQGGDLRVPHFFATHLMQVLPVCGYVLDRVCKGNVGPIRFGVFSAAVIGIAVTLATFIQALEGKPFMS